MNKRINIKNPAKLLIAWDGKVNLHWNNERERQKRYLKAEFLLSGEDIELAMLSTKIFTHGKFYKVPKEQLKNAKAGLIILELEEIIPKS